MDPSLIDAIDKIGKNFVGVHEQIKHVWRTQVLISILISCGDKFLVVLDNDKEGRKAKRRYENFFDIAFLNRYYQYENVSKNMDFELEDILSHDDQDRIKNALNCVDIKNAIPILFYEQEKTKREIVNDIDKETKDRISQITQKINTFF